MVSSPAKDRRSANCAYPTILNFMKLQEVVGPGTRMFVLDVRGNMNLDQDLEYFPI